MQQHIRMESEEVSSNSDEKEIISKESGELLIFLMHLLLVGVSNKTFCVM